MFKRFPCCNAPLGVIDKDLAEEVEEELVEGVGLRDNVFQPLHASHKLPRLARSVGHGVLQMSVLEEAGSRSPVVALAHAAHFTNDSTIDRVASHRLENQSQQDLEGKRRSLKTYLHHSQVLGTVVSLEQRVSSPAFDQNTAQRPKVNWVRPTYDALASPSAGLSHNRVLTNPENDLWRAVVTGTDHRAMVFVVKRCTAEVDEVDLRAEEHSSKLRRSRRQRAR